MDGLLVESLVAVGILEEGSGVLVGLKARYVSVLGVGPQAM